MDGQDQQDRILKRENFEMRLQVLSIHGHPSHQRNSELSAGQSTFRP